MNFGLLPLGREKLWVLLLLGPTLLGLLLGAFGSIFATLGLSFFRWDLLTQPEWAGLDNYLGLAGDRMFLRSLSNTIVFSLLYVPLTIVIAMAVALLLNRRIYGVSLFRT